MRFLRRKDDPEALATRIADEWGAKVVPGHRIDAASTQLPIVGRTLSQVTVGVGTYLILVFWGHPEYVLEVEGPSSAMSRPDSPWVEMKSMAGPFDAVLQLLGEVVVDATASQEGALHVRFKSGGEFEVAAPEGYETWQLHDDENEYLVVTHAGGGVVQFGSTPRDIAQR